MKFDDINNPLNNLIKANDIFASSLKGTLPDYAVTLGGLAKSSDIFASSLKGMLPDYAATLGGLAKSSDIFASSLKGVLPDYGVALSGFAKSNNIVASSLKGILPDYTATLGELAKSSDIFASSLKGVLPDYGVALSGFAKSNNIIASSLKGILPDYSSLLNSVNAISGVFAGFGFEDTFLSKEYIETYCEENGIADEKDKTEIQSFADDLSTGKNISGNAISDSQKKFFATYIYPLILMLIPLIFQSLTAQPTIVNNIDYTYNENFYKTEINNYYTIEKGFDSDILNSNSLRFVSKAQILVRKCADNSSSVVSELPLGKVVMIIGKYKKWVEISWQDEAGNYFSGWVQNWKVSQFK